MSKEFRWPEVPTDITGLYFRLFNRVSKVYDGAALVAYNEANITSYQLAATRLGTTPTVIGDMPEGLDAGWYDALLFSKGGSVPAPDDAYQGIATIYWNGVAASVDPAADVDVAVALTSLARIKQFLTISYTSEDQVLALLINRASKQIASYCGRRFVAEDLTEYYNGNGRNVLVLTHYPIISLSNLWVSGPNRVFDDTTLINAANVIVDKGGGRLTLYNATGPLFGFSGNRYYVGAANIKVAYRAGFETIPYDIEDAATIMIATAYKRGFQDQRYGLQSETLAERTFTYSDAAIPKKAQAVLDTYKQRGRAPDYAFAD